MNLYRYELKKIFKNRLCIILFVSLMGMNCIFGMIPYENDAPDDRYSEHYIDEIDNIIYNAKMNYLSIENKKSENAQYQLEIITRYSALRSLNVEHEVRGFDAILSSTVPYISALFWGIIVAVILIYQEYSAPLILSTFRHGRIKICVFKIIVLFMTLSAGSLVLLISQAIGVAIRSGISGMFSPIQSIPMYIHCPYRITVIQAVMLRFVIALFTVFIVALAVLLFGIIVRKAIWQLFLSALLLGVDYSLSNIYSDNIFSVFYQLNIQNFIAGNWLVRLSGKKLFCFFSQLELFGMVAFGAIALLILFSVWRFRYCNTVQVSKGRSANTASKKMSVKSLFYYEIKKMWSIKTAVAIAILMITSLVVLNTTIKAEEHDLEKIYRYYIGQMSNLSYEDQIAFSFQTKLHLNQTVSEALNVREKFIKGEETRDKYVEAQQKAGVAELELDVLRVIDRQLSSIGELTKHGIRARLIYSFGWKKLVQGNNNLFLLFSIILLIVPYITFEKESGFQAILPGILNRNRLAYRRFHFVKCLSLFIFSMIVVLLFNSSELLLIHIKYGLSDWTAYAAGAEIIFNNMQLTLVEALLLRWLFSALGVTIIIMLAKSMTVFFRKTIWVVLLTNGMELLLCIISKISNNSICSLNSFFGFEFLYRPVWVVIMQTALLMLIPIGIMFSTHYRYQRNKTFCISRFAKSNK